VPGPARGGGSCPTRWAGFHGPRNQGWRFAGAELIDDGIPYLVVAVLPDQLHQPRAGAQRAPDVGERGHRVGEEHGAEQADGKVEARGREAMGLGVGLHEADIAQALCAGQSGARASLAAEMSIPGALPVAAALAASRVVCPVPQPMSRTWSARRKPIAARRCGWQRRSSAS
jgi:hypothetical protein